MMDQVQKHSHWEMNIEIKTNTIKELNFWHRGIPITKPDAKTQEISKGTYRNLEIILYKVRFYLP